MKQSPVESKAYAFAVRIVNMYKLLSSDRSEFVLSKQVLRSGTSIGALIMEGQHAQSKPDFVNKMNVALKEANETVYWLRLLHDTSFLSDDEYASIEADATELLKMLTSIVKTAKQNM